MLPLCGRAPVRALFSGHWGSASMERAWVGPLYWIQWAGGHRRLHPRGRRTGPGGELRLPDCALPERCAGPVRSVCAPVRPQPIWLKIDGGSRRQLGLLPRQLRARRVFWGSVSGAHSRRPGGGWTTLGRRPDVARGACPEAASRRRRGGSTSPDIGCASASWRRGRSHGGALQGAQAAAGALPRASFVAAWCRVRTVHWLSTACGGGDAMVGGVEQHRRQNA